MTEEQAERLIRALVEIDRSLVLLWLTVIVIAVLALT